MYARCVSPVYDLLKTDIPYWRTFFQNRIRSLTFRILHSYKRPKVSPSYHLSMPSLSTPKVLQYNFTILKHTMKGLAPFFGPPFGCPIKDLLRLVCFYMAFISLPVRAIVWTSRDSFTTLTMTSRPVSFRSTLLTILKHTMRIALPEFSHPVAWSYRGIVLLR